MQALEHRIPPPIVFLIVAAAMGLAACFVPPAPIPIVLRLGLGLAFILAGLASAASGFRAFRRAGTTLNPSDVEAASALVTEGVFSLTRNPMYLGLAALLLGWAALLAIPWLLIGPAAFVLFITRFQILPEERAMRAKFGRAYEAYKTRVRRWL